ncbi:hypothetical protein KQX54_002520 [Cotesia glomerata]|uniref:Uncharacterized protein n=1 Tax=Cotesia glomerata TaxID=32391 RepID=A0AAV7I366_COTGL|nr:hypothetical protein KQX54_002520 [Cotesia glomerata]
MKTGRVDVEQPPSSDSQLHLRVRLKSQRGDVGAGSLGSCLRPEPLPSYAMEISDEYQDMGNPGGGVAIANMPMHHRQTPDSSETREIFSLSS